MKFTEGTRRAPRDLERAAARAERLSVLPTHCLAKTNQVAWASLARPATAGRAVASAHSRKQPPHAAQHLLHPPLRDHFHHFLRLLELTEQLIDFLDRNARASGDPALARCLEELGLRPLRRRHRIDDALDPCHLPFVGRRALR